LRKRQTTPTPRSNNNRSNANIKQPRPKKPEKKKHWTREKNEGEGGRFSGLEVTKKREGKGLLLERTVFEGSRDRTRGVENWKWKTKQESPPRPTCRVKEGTK